MQVPPGSILFWMFLRSKLRQKETHSATFIDAGCGEGWTSHQLTRLGMTGLGLEPSSKAFATLRSTSSNRIQFLNTDLQHFESGSKYDFGCSFTVIEHLEDDVGHLRQLARHVKSGGYVLVSVPSRPEIWTFEDDLVGHLRRYSSEKLETVMAEAGFTRIEIYGVGFPLINLTEKLRNTALKKKTGISELANDRDTRTAMSGVRTHRWIHTFPSILKFVINEYSLYPFHLLQLLFVRSRKCVILCAIAQVPYAINRHPS
jgi:SAM-dependent methyltransferase